MKVWIVVDKELFCLPLDIFDSKEKAENYAKELEENGRQTIPDFVPGAYAVLECNVNFNELINIVLKYLRNEDAD